MNGHFPTSLSIMNGKIYDNWCKKMKIVFCYQDMWDLVKEGVMSLAENTVGEEKATHKELNKKDYKVLCIIHHGVNPDNFEKLSDVESTKEAWKILKKSFRGAENVKDVRLQT